MPRTALDPRRVNDLELSTRRLRRAGAGRRRWARQRLLAALLLASTSAMPAVADLGWWTARQIENDAETALETGDVDRAAELYGQLVDGLERDKKRRGQALFGAAVANLELGEPALAHVRLVEMLEVFPRHERAVEARVLKGLIETRAEARQEAETPPEPPAPEPPAADTEDRTRQLESRIARLQGELRAAREELEKKEEAIEKLKQLVVGEGG